MLGATRFFLSVCLGMSDTTVWMLSGIAYDTEWNEWLLEGTRHRAPIEGNETFRLKQGGTFPEALDKWAAEARQRDRPKTEEQSALEVEAHQRLETEGLERRAV